jgi:ATP-dependent DNA ligase
MRTFQDKNSPLYEGLPFQEIEGDYGRGDSVAFPHVLEPKADGEFQYLINVEGQTYLVNKREHGRIRKDMPVTNITIPENSVFTAELVSGAGTNFYDFLRQKLSPDNNLIVFGCLRYQGEDIWKTHNYVDTRRLLEQQTFYNEKVALVPRFIANNQAELDKYYQGIVGQGYEGIVIKNPLSRYVDGATYDWVKRKYQADNDFAICGFQTNTKQVKTLSILVGHMLNGVITPLTHVGGGFKATEKDALLQKLIPYVKKKEGDDYLVEPSIVITVKHSGIIRDATGKANSLRHPQFKCFRPDKLVTQVDTIV